MSSILLKGYKFKKYTSRHGYCPKCERDTLISGKFAWEEDGFSFQKECKICRFNTREYHKSYFLGYEIPYDKYDVGLRDKEKLQQII